MRRVPLLIICFLVVYLSAEVLSLYLNSKLLTIDKEVKTHSIRQKKAIAFAFESLKTLMQIYLSQQRSGVHYVAPLRVLDHPLRHPQESFVSGVGASDEKVSVPPVAVDEPGARCSSARAWSRLRWRWCCGASFDFR